MKTLLKTLAAFVFLALIANVSMAQVEDETVINDGTTVVDEGVTCDGTGEPIKLQDGSGAGLHGQNGGAALGSGVMSQ